MAKRQLPKKNRLMWELGWLAFLIPEQVAKNAFGGVARKTVCKRPRVCLSVYVLTVLAFAALGFSLGSFSLIPVFDAYIPETAQKRSERKDVINEQWNTFLIAIGVIKPPPPEAKAMPGRHHFKVFPYDLRIGTLEQKIALLRALQLVCQYVYNFKASNGLSFRQLQEIARNAPPLSHWKNNRYNEPEMCSGAVRRFTAGEMLMQDLALLNLFPDPNTSPGGVAPSVAAEVNKAFEKTEDLEYGGWKNKYKAPPPGYLGAIGQLQWHVPAMSNWTTWQFDTIKAMSEAFKGFEVAFKLCNFHAAVTSRAYEKSEETRVLFNETPKLGVSLVLIVLSTVLVCIHCKKCKYSRVGLAFGSMGLALLSILGGLATGMLIGVPLIPLIIVVFYLMLGTGMDSGFLLMQEWCLQIQRSDFSRTNPTEINVKVARGVMLSITIADLTSVIAFTIGSFTPFLAVNVCCTYLALSITFLWFGEMFFFLPLLVIKTEKFFPKDAKKKKESKDDERENRGKTESKEDKKLDRKNSVKSDRFSLSNVDSMGPYSAVPFHEDHMTYRGELAELSDWGQFEVSKASTGYYSSSTSSTFKFSRNSSSSKKPEPNPKRHNVFNCYEKFTTQAAWGLVATHPMRYVWMITFLMIKVFFVGAVISMHTAEDVVMYYLDDSLAGHYMAKIRDFVPEGQWAGTRLLMDVPFDPQIQLTANQKFIQDMEKLNKTVYDTRYFTGGTWPDCFLRFVRSPDATGGEFLLTRRCFGEVHEPQAVYGMFRSNVTNNRWRIASFYFTLDRKNTPLNDVRKEEEVLDQLTAVEEKFSEYNLQFQDWFYGVMWRDCQMKSALWVSVIQSGACCLLMLVLFVPDLVVIGATTLMTCLTLASVLGCWAFTAGITYNSGSYIASLIAMGMCIDYTAHSGRAFFNSLRHHKELQQQRRKEHRSDDEDERGGRRPPTLEEDLMGPRRSINDKVLKDTMIEISVPLVNAAVTSTLGMFVIMVSASVPAFRQFGFAAFSVFVSSLINGVFILPICLSYIVLATECCSEMSRQTRIRKQISKKSGVKN